MINRIVLVGRLTRDPELRKTTGGNPVATFTLAVDNRMKAPNGERTTSFIPCVVWSQTAENVSKFTRKGSLVGVEGRLQQRSYDANDGRKVQVFEVICDTVQFLETKGANVKDETVIVEDTVRTDDSKNLSSIDVVDDDLPF